MIIVLVAVFMLFVVGAMAALSIDVATLYTARSEAQLAADASALAAVRVLANSGATSDTSGTGTSMANAWIIAKVVALQVAEQNQVGGANLTASQITLPAAPGGSNSNPRVTVKVLVTTLPTFFARIWGTTQLTVSASATAEAYNPTGNSLPVAPLCVKPWLLPNLDPSGPPGSAIFNADGTIASTTLLGWNSGIPGALNLACTSPNGTCTTPLPALAAWKYLPGDDATTFPHPTTANPTCNPVLSSSYQESVAGCIQVPISCTTAQAFIDLTAYPNASRNSDTADAVNCLTHATPTIGDADQVDPSASTVPFQFLGGNNNPVLNARAKVVMTSDSLVTVPVFDTTTYTPASTNVQIVGFVQLFLNPDGADTPATGNVNTTVINLAGCGTSATGTPIFGNGASPVAVRLISGP